MMIIFKSNNSDPRRPRRYRLQSSPAASDKWTALMDFKTFSQISYANPFYFAVFSTIIFCSGYVHVTDQAGHPYVGAYVMT